MIPRIIAGLFGFVFFSLVLGPVISAYMFKGVKEREEAELAAWEQELRRYLNACSEIRARQQLGRGDIDLEFCDEVISQVNETQNATDYVVGFHVVDWN